jgi:hypothetical protein
MRRWTTGILACGLVLAGCSGVDEPVAAPQAPAAAEPVGLTDVDEPDPATLIEEFGALLAAAATTGGDALERTLRVTADDQATYEPDCAPEWAHQLLTTSADGSLSVDADDETLRVGSVEVPVVVLTGRALHRTDVPCDGRLPQPDRTPDPPPTVEAAPSPRTTTTAAAPSTPTRTPPAPERPTQVDERELVAAYDAELRQWAENVWIPLFGVVQDGQRAFGAVGGGRNVGIIYNDLSSELRNQRRHWAGLPHPTARNTARTALLEGLDLWAAELRLLGACASYVQGSGCDTMPGETRELWRALFRTVTAETGIRMPSGEPAPPGPPARDPSTSPPLDGKWNIGDIRIPGEYEVRRGLGE